MTFPSVFVSSTSIDLRPYRAAVRRACDELSLGVVDMKDFEAADQGAVRASIAKLDQAGVYVGVFAHRYGFVPPGESRSVTECEFDRATELRLERLCFLLHDDHPWPDDATHRDQPERVRALHAKVLGAGLVAARFTTPDDLQHKVFLALQRWLGRQGLLGPRQVRAAAADFVGRTEALAELRAGFEGGATICGVRGQGGVGKTELALKLVEQVGDRYRDGHVFLDLRGFDKERPPLPRRDVLAHVIRAFLGPEKRLPEDDAELEGLYHSVLAGKRVLLLLDNAAGPEQLRNVLPPAGCALVVTSRRRFTLPGLTACDLDALPLAEAVTLLRTLAERVSAAEAEAIAALCGRLPLAVRLAGALLAERADVSVARYLERLRTTRLAVRTGLSEVAASVQLGEEALPEPLRTKWRELAVPAGGFELAWAAAVWGVAEETAEDDLGVLLRNSLLEWDAEAGFYRLHDLVREYAAAHLDATAREAAARRHAEYFCEAVCAAEDAFKRGGEAISKALEGFDRLWTDAQQGFGWAVERQTRETGIAQLFLRYAIGSRHVRILRQHPREQLAWAEIALTAAHKLSDRCGEGYALNNLGNAYNQLGQVDMALGCYERALAVASAIGDHRGEGLAVGNLGTAYQQLGQVDKAIGCYEQALSIEREIGDRRSEGRTMRVLGMAYADLGQTEKAIRFYEQALAIARAIGDRRTEGNALEDLGNAYANRGQADKAIRFYEQALAISREIGDRHGEAIACWNLGAALVKLGRLAEAIPLLQMRVSFEREVGRPNAEKDAAQVEQLRRQLAEQPHP